VARRLFAVIVAALLMGLVLGGLRVADAEASATQFGRVSQLAKLSQQLTIMVDDLQNERDATLAQLVAGDAGPLRPYYAATNAEANTVKALAGGIGGAYPANIRGDAERILADISSQRIRILHTLLNPLAPANNIGVIADYGADITDMIVLADQVAQGVADSALASDVRALNALSLAKEQVSQQRALLNYAFASAILATGSAQQNLDDPTSAALPIAGNAELTDEAAFQQSATPAELTFFTDAMYKPDISVAQDIEASILGTPVTDGQSQLLGGVQAVGLDIQAVQTADKKLDRGITPPSSIVQGQAAWTAGMGDEMQALQSTEGMIAGNIVTRTGQLQSNAQQSALTFGIITVAVLLLVMLGAVLVARSLVRPLRRLRAGALNIASVQLPERVRLLSDNPDSASTMEVAPIAVTTRDEIGQVARAFDQVHAEAVRLAGEQALLRSSFNAMFVNLSRRSQSLIERLARMIDNLEQTEDDPNRLGSLFAMDHLVTRMRRNSENLLLLAGHENPRKWSDPVPLADVARAATSEIEQYNRVALTIAPGISVVGQAVSDVVHLLAELIENATIFSPKESQVLLHARELTSGGVLIEIIDEGIGVSESRLAEMNWRLDNPPTIDVSVSRHMGLFAVARLAERHQVRVRLRTASPQGMSALVWLPDGVIERTSGLDTGQWAARTAGGLPVRTPRGQESAILTATPIPIGEPAFGSGHGNGNGNGRGGAVPVRTAEQVRSRLTGFQRGARRAETQSGRGGQGGVAPRAGEGTKS